MDFNYEIKSIDMSSATIIGATISTIYAVIISVILLILAGAGGGTEGVLGSLTVIPSIIFCTLIIATYNIFTKTYFYNILSNKFGKVKINLLENKEIKKISIKEYTINITLINTIIFIIYVLIAILFLPLVFGLVYQILVVSGNMTFAYMVYQVVFLFSDPLFLVSLIILSAVAEVIVCLISAYSYNLLTESIYGVLVKLHKEDNYTIIDSFNPVNTALILGIIGLILGIVEAIINLIAISSGFTANTIIAFVSIVLGGFIGTFVLVFISSYLYNMLAPKMGKVKIELDEI